jgi:thiamine-monophosphate kinase
LEPELGNASAREVVEISENALIARIAGAVGVRPGVLVGIGDDAAVFTGAATMVAAHDMLVAGVHFRPETRSWSDVGHAALAVNLSDIAAMGAEPVCALVGLTVPAGLPSSAIDDLYGAMEALASEHGCTIAGGDTSAAEIATIGVTVIGRMPTGLAPVLRSTAAPGDLVVVTGPLGGSAAGLEILTRALAVPNAAGLIARHQRPQPLVAAGRVLAEAGVSAMLDCSDGLILDATRLADASGCRVVIDLDLVPLHEGVADVARQIGRDTAEFAATGGEDYELIFAVAADGLAQVSERLPDAPIVVGYLQAGQGTEIVRAGQAVTLPSWGWSHDV